MEFDIERSPDKRASSAKLEIEGLADAPRWVLEVRGHGAVLLRSHLDAGKWAFDTVAIFSEEELKFDE